MEEHNGIYYKVDLRGDNVFSITDARTESAEATSNNADSESHLLIIWSDHLPGKSILQQQL